MDCLFCRINQKKIPAKIVFEDDDIIAFEDINPQAPIHILIIPRLHISTVNNIDEADANLIGKLAITASNIAKSKGVAKDGYRLVMNCNGDGGQTVFHIHMHLLAGRQMMWPPG